MTHRHGLRGLAGLITAFALLLPIGAAAEFRVPALRGAVNDEADMLSRATRAQLEDALRVLREQGGTQLAVLTVPSLAGITIEQASIQVTDAWKLGNEKRDDGVLLMIARDERRMRIEVGQGLEGALTDAHAKRIIDEAMTPLFRAGEIDAGVVVGVYEIAKRTNPDLDLRPHLEAAAGASRRGVRGDSSGGSAGLFPFLLFGLIVLARFGRFGGHRRGRRYLWGPAMYGTGIGMGMGRGRSFGGGGFGGFSGGGGGFSGGGASGGW